MKILITGGTGFLGSHLVKEFVRRGWQLIVLKRSFSNTGRITSMLASVQTYDIDCIALEQIFLENTDIDAVIHTATCYGRKGENSACIREANYLFPVRLLELSVEHGVSCFFNTDTFSSQVIKNNSYLKDYNKFKQDFALYGKQISDKGVIAFINIRLQHLYGPGDDVSKFVPGLIKKCLDNVPSIELTPGEQKRDFIHVRDVVNGFCLLLEREIIYGFLEYQMGTSSLISISDFSRKVKELTKTDAVLKFGAIDYRQDEIMESCASNSELLKLGWQPEVSLEQGINSIIDFFRETNEQ